MALDKLVLLRHLKRAEPYSGEKLASHIKDYYIIYALGNKRMYEGFSGLRFDRGVLLMAGT